MWGCGGGGRGGCLVAEFETESQDFRVGGVVAGARPGAHPPPPKTDCLPIYSFISFVYFFYFFLIYLLYIVYLLLQKHAFGKPAC